MNIEKKISELVEYGVNQGIVDKRDRIFVTNSLLLLFNKDEAYEGEVEAVTEETLPALLNDLTDYAYETGMIADNGIVSRDLFDTRVMGLLMPPPSVVIDKFNALKAENPEKATDYFYKLSKDVNYIRRDRIKKDKKWVTETPYGDLDITINLSKPEKDPKAIAAARTM